MLGGRIMRNRISIYDVAKYFLFLSAPGTSYGVTPLKLQKLVFYSQAVSYSLVGRRLFEEDFQAWVHGPVSPELYYAYKIYGSNEIDKEINPPKLNDKDKKIIQVVWKMYGDKDGKYLENKTHKEEPWQHARSGLSYYEHSNKIIDKRIIRKYYKDKFIIKPRELSN
jgi:uncharacterized phage-associated protein